MSVDTAPRFFLTKEAEDEARKLEALRAAIRRELEAFGDQIIVLQDQVADLQRMRLRLAGLARDLPGG